MGRGRPARTEVVCQTMDPLNQDVLVLNSDYEPINICNLRRAIGMVCLG